LYFFPEVVPVFLHLFRIDLNFLNYKILTTESFGNVLQSAS
jgi:hypothetical protein